jgi:hypothetical protein
VTDVAKRLPAPAGVTRPGEIRSGSSDRMSKAKAFGVLLDLGKQDREGNMTPRPVSRSGIDI